MFTVYLENPLDSLSGENRFPFQKTNCKNSTDNSSFSVRWRETVLADRWFELVSVCRLEGARPPVNNDQVVHEQPRGKRHLSAHGPLDLLPLLPFPPWLQHGSPPQLYGHSCA